MKKVLCLVIGLVFLMAVTGCASSLRVITGVVADVDGNPIGGVLVTTDPPTASVYTDESGRYMIKAYKDSEYTLRASKMGYVATPIKISAKGVDFVQGDIRITPEEMMVPVYQEPAVEAVESGGGAKAVVPEAGAKTEAAGAEKSADKAWWEK